MNKAFWVERFERNGHTGWGDQLIYDFDQELRLKIFSRWVSDFTPGLALDFGAGSREFSKLLINLGWMVVAYDRYVTGDFSHPRLYPSCDLREALSFGPFDIAISITVLDFIMDEIEFNDSLRQIAGSLRGKFFFLEYSPEKTKEQSSYQVFRTLDHWRRSLQSAFLELDTVEPFFHPEEAPFSGWDRYRTDALVKIASRLRLRRFRRSRARKWQTCYKPPQHSPIHVLAGTH